MGFADSASQDARRLFSLHPTYPSMTQAIMKEYASVEKGSHAIPVLKDLLSEYSKNDTASGNLHFHLAQLLYEDSQIQPALEELNSAEASFRRSYSSDHQVFKAIKELRETLEKPQ